MQMNPQPRAPSPVAEDDIYLYCDSILNHPYFYPLTYESTTKNQSL